jgi:glycosyltransferase involved in cell wall biosynthesis
LKRVLIIHHGIGIGGGLIALLGLIDELKQKNDIKVLCIFNSEAVDYIKKAGVEVFLPKSKFYKKYYNLFLHSEASYFGLADLVRNSKNLIFFYFSKYLFAKNELEYLNFSYDIVYLNSTFISDWLKSAKKLNKKTIIHIREPLANGIFGFRKRIIKKNIDHYSDQVIAISQDNSKRIGLFDKTTVIYDPVVYKNREIKGKIVLQPNFKYFLYLGGTLRIKGFEQFVKSLPYINDNVKIFFLGPNHSYSNSRLDRFFAIFDPYFWKIKSLRNELKKSTKIIHVGLVDNIFDYYYNTTAVISPFSKPHACLPILEAFSVYKPAIVSNVPGMDEIVNVDNGIFFKNRKPKKLAASINKMALMNPEEYEKMCHNAHSRFEELMFGNGSVQLVIDKI